MTLEYHKATPPGGDRQRSPAAESRPAARRHPGVLQVVAEQLARVKVEELQFFAARSLEHDRAGLLVDAAAEVRPVVDPGAAVVEPRPVAVRQPGAEDRDRLDAGSMNSYCRSPTQMKAILSVWLLRPSPVRTSVVASNVATLRASARVVNSATALSRFRVTYAFW